MEGGDKERRDAGASPSDRPHRPPGPPAPAGATGSRFPTPDVQTGYQHTGSTGRQPQKQRHFHVFDRGRKLCQLRRPGAPLRGHQEGKGGQLVWSSSLDRGKPDAKIHILLFNSLALRRSTGRVLRKRLVYGRRKGRKTPGSHGRVGRTERLLRGCHLTGR